MLSYAVGLCLIFYSYSVVTQVININDDVDKCLNSWNLDIKNTKDTLFGLLAGKIGENVSYSDGYLYGLDSLARTANCTKTSRMHSTSYDCHIGLRLLLLAFPMVTIDGQKMSLYLRVRNNSFHFRYTVLRSSNKSKYQMDTYELEAFENVDMGASVAKYDGLDVNEFFRTTVRPIADGIIKEVFDIDTSSEEDTPDKSPDQSDCSIFVDVLQLMAQEFNTF